jgi:CarboxypepD_reg-like domain
MGSFTNIPLRLKYFTYLLLFVSLTARAQSLQGVVTDAITGKALYPVTVVNVSTQEVTYTSERGTYAILAKPGEVVAFTYIGYKTVEKVKPNSVLVATLDIAMDRTTYQLQEFKIRPGHLTQYQIDSLERVQTYRVVLARRPPSPFMSPASAIAEQFSRRAKRAYEFQKNFYAGETEKFIDTRYTPDLVTKLTGATGDTIGHFMYAYPMPYDYARTATDLELQMWIRSNYRLWMQAVAKDSILKKN